MKELFLVAALLVTFFLFAATTTTTSQTFFSGLSDGTPSTPNMNGWPETKQGNYCYLVEWC